MDSPPAIPSRKCNDKYSESSFCRLEYQPSASSSSSSKPSTPEPTAIVYTVKQTILPYQRAARESTIAVYLYLEDANNKVYSMRLDHETCHPCFFYYGAETNGGALSWEIPNDKFEEDGIKVFVQRTEVAPSDNVVLENENVITGMRDWRKAIEPMAGWGEDHWKPFQNR